MPIYEFYCPDHHRIYSFLAKSLSDAGKVPRCPDVPGHCLERLVSGFAVVGKAKEPAAAGAQDDLDDPRMERAMMEMEREMGSMNEANPDPRNLARMMRRMSELTGEKLGGPMEEMMKRLEAGEDPERLEKEFGDLPDAPFGDEGAGGGPEAEERKGGLRRMLRAAPRRDPQLYDIREHLD